MHWLINIIISALVSSVISSSLIAFLAVKFRISMDMNTSGIKRIYAKGHAIDSLERMITSDDCREICILAFSAESFNHAYKTELTKFVARGGDLKYLLVGKDEAFARHASELEGRNPSTMYNSVVSSLGLIDSIEKEAVKYAARDNTSAGTVSIRQYTDEIRNQMILCKTRNNKRRAWLSILMPPLAAVNCQLIEYSKCEECENYFNVIWNKYGNTNLEKERN